MRGRLPALVFGFLSLLILMGVAGGEWLSKVSSSDHQKANPFGNEPEAVAAGQNLYLDHCSTCHGKSAEGTKKRPSLLSSRVQQEATEGDLHWLLVNGNPRRGMPSWSRLPDPQLWQLVSYLKSLAPRKE
jgi:mono/diheme cytochrome c family protein